MTPDEARKIDMKNLGALSDEKLKEAIRLLEGLAEVALAHYFSSRKDESKVAVEIADRMNARESLG